MLYFTCKDKILCLFFDKLLIVETREAAQLGKWDNYNLKSCTVMRLGKGKRGIYFKKAPVYSSSVQRCGHIIFEAF